MSLNHTILLSEETFMILEYHVLYLQEDTYGEDKWMQKYVLALNFANALKITIHRYKLLP